MKNLKRLLTLLLALCLALSMASFSFAAEPERSGTVGGSDVTWSLSSSGRLTIAGSGDTERFTSPADQPWAEVREDIQEVWFYDMADLAISDLAYWFTDCVNLTSAEVPYTTPLVGADAFAGCPSLTRILFYYQDEHEFAIEPGAFAVNGEVETTVCVPASEQYGAIRVTTYDWAGDGRHIHPADVYGVQSIPDSNKIKAIGEDARLMLGRTPGNIVAVRPLRQGVISDYTVTEKMLRYFIQKSCGKSRFRKPRISVCVPSGVTEVEKKAVEDATYEAGAREVAIIEEPIAAAIGAGIDISRPCGNMIVDIGGGTADIAVISLGGTVVSTSIKVAGDNFDEAIVRYMRKTHNLLIGERTAEEIKINIGSAYQRPEVVSMDVRGRNLVTGLPKTITVTSDETLEALKEITSQIVEAVHSVLEKTPPELAADVADRGIVLTGGGSLLYGLEELIEEKTGINTMTAEDPMTAVAVGTGKFVEFLAGVRDDE